MCAMARARATLVALGIVVAVLSGCGDDSSPARFDVAATGPSTELAPSSTVGDTAPPSVPDGPTTTTPRPAVTHDQILHFRDALVSAPYLQGFDLSIPGSLDELLGYRDVIVTGTVVAVRAAEPERLHMFDGQESVPDGADFAEMGVLVEVSVERVETRSDTVAPLRPGEQLLIRFPLVTGQIDQGDLMRPFIEPAVAAAPIGASVVALLLTDGAGGLELVPDGSVRVGPFFVFMAPSLDDPSVALHPEIGAWADGTPLRDVVPQSALDSTALIVATTAPPASGPLETADREQIARFSDVLMSGPAALADISPPHSLDELLRNLDTVVAGTVSAVTPAPPQRVTLFPDQESMPNGAELAEAGLLVEITVTRVETRPGVPTPVEVGATLRLQFPLASGQISEPEHWVPDLEALASDGPVGASVVVTLVSDGAGGLELTEAGAVRLMFPIPVFMAEAPDGASIAMYPEMGDWADGPPLDQLIPPGALDRVPATPEPG
jgi:hypothetical protein